MLTSGSAFARFDFRTARRVLHRRVERVVRAIMVTDATEKSAVVFVLPASPSARPDKQTLAARLAHMLALFAFASNVASCHAHTSVRGVMPSDTSAKSAAVFGLPVGSSACSQGVPPSADVYIHVPQARSQSVPHSNVASCHAHTFVRGIMPSDTSANSAAALGSVTATSVDIFSLLAQ